MQLVYTMSVSNISVSFHLWGKENLVKHQRVSKYYENDCRFKGLATFLWCLIGNSKETTVCFGRRNEVSVSHVNVEQILNLKINFVDGMVLFNQKQVQSWSYEAKS